MSKMVLELSVLPHCANLMILLCTSLFGTIDGVKQRAWTGPSVFISGAPDRRSDVGFESARGKLFAFAGWTSSSGNVNDFYRFDPLTLQWTNLTTSVNGLPPSKMGDFGFTSIENELFVFGGLIGVNVISDLFRFDVSLLLWTNLSSQTTGTAPSARGDVGCTSANGLVFVFGGWDGTAAGFFNNLYSFDPVTLFWTDLSSQVQGISPSSRADLGFHSLNGHIYLFGGWQGQGYFNDLYRLNPSTLVWTLLPALAGNVPSPRTGHGFAPSGELLYVMGGWDGSDLLNDLYSWDPSTLQWTEISKAAYPLPRAYFGFAEAEDYLFVFAGESNGGTATGFNDLFRYDTAIQEWTNMSGEVQGTFPASRTSVSLSSVGNKIYLFGGIDDAGNVFNDLHEYDPSRVLWQQVLVTDSQFPPPSRHGHGSTSADNKLFIFGGRNDSASFNDLHRFDPSTLLWTDLSIQSQGTPPSPRYLHGLTSVSDQLCVFGGWSDDGPGFLNDLFCFVLGTLTWIDWSESAQGEAPSPRYGHSVASVGSTIFVYGGLVLSGSSDELFSLDTSTFLWTDLSAADGSPPSARGRHGLLAADSKLFVFGGFVEVGSDFYVNVYNDLHMFDVSNYEWAVLTPQIEGQLPLPRYDMGWASVDGKLFAFGGLDSTGNIFDELIALTAPAELSWANGAGEDFFIGVYDWDKLILGSGVIFELNWHLQLCTLLFPCALSVKGNDGGSVARSRNGSIACLSSLGCTALSFDSVAVSCDESVSLLAVLEVEGISLAVQNCSFNSCLSLSDGGVIQAYRSASILIQNSAFHRAMSLGLGGSVSTIGGTLSVFNSTFTNSSSSLDGGAISISTAFCSCSGPATAELTTLLVRSCTFTSCRAEGAGGAITVTGGQLNAFITGSTFEKCASATAGGALSIVAEANMTVMYSSFVKNSASGVGGGAVYVQSAAVSFQDVHCTGNEAVNGGGGSIYWSGGTPPQVVTPCGPGSRIDSSSNCNSTFCFTACSACSAGTFQTGDGEPECSLCPAGTYSSGTGSTSDESCISCALGMYSTTLGASDSSHCMICLAGSYSILDDCSACVAGTYSVERGATNSSSCIGCHAGKFSAATGASHPDICEDCGPGSYSYSGSTRCEFCVAGKYSSAIRASTAFSCTSCLPGMYSTVIGSVSAQTCEMCEAGKFSPTRFYIYYMDVMSWHDAQAECISKGGSLPSISSDAENQEILNVVPQQYDFWIGYSYNSTLRQWLWADGSDIEYNNWADENPKKENELYHCAVFPSYNGSFVSTTGVWGGWPYFQEVIGFTPGSTGYSLAAGSWYNLECENAQGWVWGYVCSFAGATSCVDCAEGKYSTSPGASAPESCVQCGTNITSNGSTVLCECDESQSCWSPENNSTARAMGMSLKQESTTNLATLSVSLWPEARRQKLGYHREFPSSPQKSSMQSDNTEGKERVKQKEILNTAHSQQQSRSTRRHAKYHSNSKNRRLNFWENDPGGDSEHVSISKGPFCGQGNIAYYGPCLASSYSFLKVSGLPSASAPAFAGLSFSIVVEKKDIYNSTVYSDSSSVLEVTSALLEGIQAISPFSIGGNSAGALRQGKLELSFYIKPSFADVVPSLGVARLSGQPLVYLQGIDSQSQMVDTLMRSDQLQIFMFSDSRVCPPGTILILDQSADNSSHQTGSCSSCGVGTYSVSPLAGYTPIVPSCFNCPAGALRESCKGGNMIAFSSGTWMISGGIFKLVACPAGNQLVNSVNGLFSHDIQQCLPCQQNQYILDSNNSDYSCQTCPVGAVCNGSALEGLISGSIWQPDAQTGLYVLVSCPAGYERLGTTQDAQECSVCPPAYYCTGGSAARTPCPSGTFSMPGGNASSSCTQAVLVEVLVSFFITKDEFSPMQDKFEQSLAAAAGVAVRNVVLESVTNNRRIGSDYECAASLISPGMSNYRIQGPSMENAQQSMNGQLKRFAYHKFRSADAIPSLDVAATIATSDALEAAAVTSKLSTPSLNQEFAQVGIPQGTLKSVTTSIASAPSSNAELPVSLIAGVSVGGFILFWAILLAMLTLYRKLRIQAARSAFLKAFRTAEPGEEACQNNLPQELRRLYQAQRVIGKGAYGCVLCATAKQGSLNVAIKLLVPEKGIFGDRQLRQLRREAEALAMLTGHKCDHAVHLSGSEPVHIRDDLCWFVMEYLCGQDMEAVIKDKAQGPISDVECIKAGRSVLAALKVMHADGLIHRDIKPANIMRCRDGQVAVQRQEEGAQSYKLIDFGTTLGVDETVARQSMMTLVDSRNIAIGTLPYMSPEMFKEPERASYPTDIWSLGVTLFELVTGCLPFVAESDLLLSLAIAGNMEEPAPSVLDALPEGHRAAFDNNLARVVATALEKRVEARFESADEMHEALYCCLICRDEAFYSVFISYRVVSETPFARLLFDDLNHSVTPGGHRVTVYWDAHRLVKGENWEESFATGLTNSLCFFPLLSYGSTAPLAELPPDRRDDLLRQGWDMRPCGRARLEGCAGDDEDNVLKELLIAEALMGRRAACDADSAARGPEEKGMLQVVYPILIGRQEPPGHPAHPGMGSFFDVQGGGGKYPASPSLPSNKAVARFLRDSAGLPETAVGAVGSRGVAECMRWVTALQGCQMWDHPADLLPAVLTREQRGFAGRGCTGPAVALGGVALSQEQREACGRGLTEVQLAMLKAEIRHKRSFFHEIIDRAVAAKTPTSLPQLGERRQSLVARRKSNLSRHSCTAADSDGPDGAGVAGGSLRGHIVAPGLACSTSTRREATAAGDNGSGRMLRVDVAEEGAPMATAVLAFVHKAGVDSGGGGRGGGGGGGGGGSGGSGADDRDGCNGRTVEDEPAAVVCEGEIAGLTWVACEWEPPTRLPFEY